MSKNEENHSTPPPSLGEISTIRDILMGQQMNEYDSKFSIVDEKINKVEAELINRLEEMEARISERFEAFQKEMNKRLEAIEKQATTNTENLERKIEKATNAENVRLGKMLAKVSKQLLGE